MFGYNQPTLEKYIGVPFGFGLLAYAIVRLFPSPEAVFFFAAVEINVAIIPAIFLIRQFTDYEKGEREPAQEVQPVKAYLDMNKADERGNVYAQATGGIRIDCIKKFNQTLIDQRNGNLVVDLSEGFWIKKIGDVEENRWTRIGGQGPTEFRTMLKRGEKFGAYKQTNGQGKWIPNPDGWNKIRRLANGEPLPQ